MRNKLTYTSPFFGGLSLANIVAFLPCIYFLTNMLCAKQSATGCFQLAERPFITTTRLYRGITHAQDGISYNCRLGIDGLKNSLGVGKKHSGCILKVVWSGVKIANADGVSYLVSRSFLFRPFLHSLEKLQWLTILVLLSS